MKPYDRTLLDIFSAEQTEHVGRIRAILKTLASARPEQRTEAFDEVLRRAHTLKGAARAVGLETTERVAHVLETLIGRVRDGELSLDNRTDSVIRRGLETIEDVLSAALAGRAEPPAAGFLEAAESGSGGLPDMSPSAPAPAPIPGSPTMPAVGVDFVRVNAARIDELIRSASQLVTTSHAQAAVEARTAAYLRNAGDTLAQYLRLRRQSSSYVREHRDDPHFAPVRECLEYVDEQLRTLTANAHDADVAERHRSWAMRREIADLYQNAIRVRMIPAESVFGAFGAMVREIARDEGKDVDFRVEGLDAQADRLVLQALKDPVMHLLRNAVFHGIELPPDRIRAGKPGRGTIRLAIDSEGDRLNVVVEDDGRGLDLGSIAAQAVKRGLLPESEAEAITPAEAAKLILRPGFSTSDVATSISGRGMGLSIVQHAASQLQGEVHVYPRSRGLGIRISAALSISMQQVLLVAVAGRTFALPARSVQRLLRIRAAEPQFVENREVVLLDSKPVPLLRLSVLLGIQESEKPSANEPSPFLTVVVMSSAHQTVGLVVDSLADSREAVIKDLGLNAELCGMGAGGVPLENGSVAILLNPAALCGRLEQLGNQPSSPKAPEQPAKKAPRILVVDDSITTRSLEKSILEAHGYRVRLAVDGVDALEQLSTEPVELVITDIAMPRMDGLQLLEQLKKRKDTEHVPVIIVTSLESREDQQRGLSLGADAYIVKRKFDQQELLRTVRQIL